jgi:hypothetical protein
VFGPPRGGVGGAGVGGRGAGGAGRRRRRSIRRAGPGTDGLRQLRMGSGRRGGMELVSFAAVFVPGRIWPFRYVQHGATESRLRRTGVPALLLDPPERARKVFSQPSSLSSPRTREGLRPCQLLRPSSCNHDPLRPCNVLRPQVSSREPSHSRNSRLWWANRASESPAGRAAEKGPLRSALDRRGNSARNLRSESPLGISARNLRSESLFGISARNLRPSDRCGLQCDRRPTAAGRSGATSPQRRLRMTLADGAISKYVVGTSSASLSR